MSGCENVGVCAWCRREVGGNHACETLCLSPAVQLAAAGRQGI